MEEALDKLKSLVIELGTQRAVANKLEISEPYLSDILSGRRDISNHVAEKLGFVWKLVKFVHLPLITFTGKGDEIGKATK